MNTIIAGSRSITSRPALAAAIHHAQGRGLVIGRVLSGGADGVDRLGEQWASAHGLPVQRIPADWRRFGRSAGPRRNAEMVAQAEAVVALWDGASAGTAQLVEAARRRGLAVFLYRVHPCGRLQPLALPAPEALDVGGAAPAPAQLPLF